MDQQPITASTSPTEQPRIFFSRLPLWGKVLFILIWPVSLGYLLYRMWKTQAFTQNIRIVLTAVGVLFTLAMLISAGQEPETPIQTATQAAPKTNQHTTQTTPEPEPDTAVETEKNDAVQVIAVTVTRIVDGDTIEVTMPDGMVEKVRLIGVDTPEATSEIEALGPEATAYTSTALSGKTVYLETDAEIRDRYGRLLAHVWLEVPGEITDAEVRAHLFNAHLLLDGYANLMTIPPNVKYVDYLSGYESEARTASVGMWAPTPPLAPAPAATPAPAPTPAPAAPTPTPSGSYIANSNTGKFHYASCSSVDQMNEEHKVPYSSREQAVAAGYVPCGRCKP